MNSPTLASLPSLTWQSFNNNAFFLIFSIFFISPIWLTEIPPMVDIPQHASQIATLKQILEGADNDNLRAFEINWFTPYLTGYLLGTVLLTVFPIQVAIKLLLSAAMLATFILTGMLLKTVGADERWKWLTLPSIYGYCFNWGFLNFIVATPLGLLFLLLSVRYSRSRNIALPVSIALLSIMLFFSHIIILGFMSLLAISYHFAVHHSNIKTFIQKCWPYTIPIPLIVIWGINTYSGESQVSTATTVWRYGIHRIAELRLHYAGFEQGGMEYLPAIFLMCVPFFFRARFNKSPARWLPFLTGLLVYLLFPLHTFGTAFLYPRFGGFLPVLWYMAWDTPSSPQKHQKKSWAILIILVGILAFHLTRFGLFASEQRHFHQILDAMEPGKKSQSLVYTNKAPGFHVPVYLHMPAWYQATKRGVSDFSFALFMPEMVRYTKEASSNVASIKAGACCYHKGFKWGPMDQQYTYFVVRNKNDIGEAAFGGRAILEKQSGLWWLYKNNKASDGQ